MFLSHVWIYRELIWQLIKREVVGRYRGSWLGLAWSFANPILLLTIYTFFFSIIYQSRWGGGNKFEFALTLFAGLIPYTLFSECINRAPLLITNHVNYVKKVIFPLEILPWVNLGAALFHAFISILVLLLFCWSLHHYLPWTFVLLPLVFLPLIFLILGCAWVLASLGVFIRDIAQTITLLTMALLFLSPVFYPIAALPEQYRHLIYLNPLTTIIEQSRAVLILGQLPNWHHLAITLLVSVFIAWLGYQWFKRVQHLFADVV